jgi:hypothetical protein
LPQPSLYIPDGSGNPCNPLYGTAATNPARWVTGAALMPDRTNILISYIGVCVLSGAGYGVESWGFTMFNWKTRRFSVKPVDVFPPQPSGAEHPHELRFGSPIIANGKVTFFSSTRCDNQSCDAPRSVFTTTMPAKAAALKNPASYDNRNVVPSLHSVPNMTVSPKSKTRPYLTMYQFAGELGQYTLLKAPAPNGPWKRFASGSLPKCNTGRACVSVALHPLFSSSSRMVASYYVPGYGPGVKKHPDPSGTLGHVVLASLPG